MSRKTTSSFRLYGEVPGERLDLDCTASIGWEKILKLALQTNLTSMPEKNIMETATNEEEDKGTWRYDVRISGASL